MVINTLAALMALYARRTADADACASVEEYVRYVLREPFDCETGDVFSDVRRDDSFQRLLNAP